jgi:SEC-C motif
LKGASPEDIQTLIRLAREARAKDQDDGQVAQAIEDQTSPQRIAALVRKHPNVLPVLLSILLWLVPPPYDWATTTSASPARVTVTQLENLADHEMDALAQQIARDIEQDEKNVARPGHAELPRLHPQGRNEPCRCGSGAKYKKCCGGPHAKAS